MGIRYEKLKTFLLLFLVVLSLVLTWNLWTYQPHYKILEKNKYLQNETYVSPVKSASKKELIDHIKFSQVVYHGNGSDYGATIEKNIDNWLNEVKTWKFANVYNYTPNVPSNDFDSFLHMDNAIELIYPDNISMKAFKDMFQVEGKSVPDFYFNRIFLKEKRGQSAINAYFVDTKTHQIFVAIVSNFLQHDFDKKAEKMQSLYAPYTKYKIRDGKYIYLPKQSVTLDSLMYYSSPLDVDKFKNVLFGNPTYVKKEKVSNEEFYTDGTSVLAFVGNQDVIEYANWANLGTSNSEAIEVTSILKRSFNFVNDHGGWTDAYYFSKWNPDKREVMYQLHENNYPVFSTSAPTTTEIYEKWGKAEVAKYRRPIYKISRTSSGSFPVKLSSGLDIIKSVEKIPNLDRSQLQDIAIGYELVPQQQNDSLGVRRIALQPAWFYLYKGKWNKVESLKESGGASNGLE